MRSRWGGGVVLLALVLAAGSVAAQSSLDRVEELDRLARSFLLSSRKVPPLMRLRALAAASAHHQDRMALVAELGSGVTVPQPSYDAQEIEAELKEATATLRLKLEATGDLVTDTEAVIKEGLIARGYAALTKKPGKQLDVRVASSTQVTYEGVQASPKTGDDVHVYKAVADFGLFDAAGTELGRFRETYTYRAQAQDKALRLVAAGYVAQLRERSIDTIDRLLKARPPKK